MRSLLRLLFGIPLSWSLGCAPWHDFFQRDQPQKALVEETLRVQGPSHTDVAIILGCPAREGGLLSPCLSCRVSAALRAYSQGRVRALLFTGGAAHNRHVEAEVMAQAALSRGVPKEHIFVEGRALTTWQNLRFAKRIMAQKGFHNALIISTADHLPRARRFSEYYGISARYMACEHGP